MAKICQAYLFKSNVLKRRAASQSGHVLDKSDPQAKVIPKLSMQNGKIDPKKGKNYLHLENMEFSELICKVDNNTVVTLT